ncbi:3-oxo-tetronate kinase [Nonomuraea sp. NPDC004297]
MIGVIADDFTGGTDVAVALRRRGIRTLLYFGLPPHAGEFPEHDAVVIALKTRTVHRADAVARSLRALRWLRSHGAAEQVYFKYCATFDSTRDGNIGPVLDALADAMDAPIVPMTPSSPEHGRTQYNGYLFVGEALLGESHMRHHPLTPMTDSYLPRLLEAQSAYRAGVVTLPQVRGRAIGRRLAELREQNVRYAFVDALEDSDLMAAGHALAGAPLLAGAAGLAGGLAAAHARHEPDDALWPEPSGRAAVLAGSCSASTLQQVRVMIEAGRPAYRLDALADQDRDSLARNALAWYDTLDESAGAPLVYASLEPARLRRVQDALGVERSAAILETAIGRVARGLVERGVTRVITAGGETSGAVVSALGVSGGVIGAEAARGVPWIFTPSGVTLLLKSGDLGEPDLLLEVSR